jgi:ribose transport system substrate-binding protein
MNRNRMAKFFVVALVLLLAVVSQTFGAAEKEDDGAYEIVFIMKSLSNPFFIDMEDGAREEAARLGVNLTVLAPQREIDTAEQMTIVENQITLGVDAICLVPNGSTELAPAIKAANDAGIPVLLVDTKMDPAAMAEAGAFAETFIGSDNYLGGSIAAETIAELLGGSGKVAVLEGIPGHETAYARDSGFKETIANYPGIEIVASQTANWDRAEGLNVFTNILQGNPDLDALFAANDQMGLGAIQAIESAGMTGEIIVVGFDANNDARAAIEEGTMYGSIAQFPNAMGVIGVRKAVELLDGGTIDAEIGTEVGLVTK